MHISVTVSSVVLSYETCGTLLEFSYHALDAKLPIVMCNFSTEKVDAFVNDKILPQHCLINSDTRPCDVV